jgi:hypothetical protein
MLIQIWSLEHIGTIGGGVESISLVQPKMLKSTVIESGLSKSHPHIWMPMIQTADIIATKYVICVHACCDHSINVFGDLLSIME